LIRRNQEVDWGSKPVVDMLVEVVIPSFEGHLLFLHDQLASWYRYCIDASRVNFTIVTSDFAETVLFRKALKRLETMLSIRVLDVWESLRAAGEHISHARLLRLIGKPSNPEERPLVGTHMRPPRTLDGKRWHGRNLSVHLWFGWKRRTVYGR